MSFAIKIALVALLLPVSVARAEQNSLKVWWVRKSRFSVQYASRWLADKGWRGPAEKTP